MRRAAKTDAVQSFIVEGLRKCGYHVEIIGQPVDLLIGVGRAPFLWKLLELKTPQKNGKRRNRKDQRNQDEFLRLTGTPVVCTLEEALKALGAV